LISKREAQVLAVEHCDYEMPQDFEREEVQILSCEFDEADLEWKICVRMSFGHGDIIEFECDVAADGEVSSSWAAV